MKHFDFDFDFDFDLHADLDQFAAAGLGNTRKANTPN